MYAYRTNAILEGRCIMNTSRQYINASSFTTEHGDTYLTARCIFCGKDATIYIKAGEKRDFSQRSGCFHFFDIDWTFGPSLIFEREINNPGERVLT